MTRHEEVVALQAIAARMASELADLEFSEDWQLSEITSITGACAHIREELFRLWHQRSPKGESDG